MIPMIPKSNNNEVIRQKILNFRNLEPGWHFGEGVTPSDQVINTAIRLNKNAHFADFAVTNAFAGVNGEVQVTAYDDKHFYELTVEKNGLITFVHEYDDEIREYIDNLPYDKAVKKLFEHIGEKWALLDSYIQKTSTTTENDLQVSNLNPQVMEAEYLFSRKPAAYPKANVSANTLVSTTRISKISQSSGTLSPKSFQTTASSFRKSALQGILATTI